MIHSSPVSRVAPELPGAGPAPFDIRTATFRSGAHRRPGAPRLLRSSHLTGPIDTASQAGVHV